MMSRRFQHLCVRLVGLQFVLLLLSLLFSWAGSLYELPVGNLLAKEGVRWMLRHVMTNFASMPILSLLLLLMGWGVLSASGWLVVCRFLFSGRYKDLTPKQKWAFQVSLISLMGYLFLLAFGFFGDEPVLLSVTGELTQSPLADGAPVVILLGVSLCSSVYAWVSGRFRRFSDFTYSVVKGIADWAVLFVNLFLLGQQIALFRYMFTM
ncbi:MAG: AbgT family transporter [Bacteroidaceae bacterium]|nr:AbgT family transporter [Bacteroidaceae bacterium]